MNLTDGLKAQGETPIDETLKQGKDVKAALYGQEADNILRAQKIGDVLAITSKYTRWGAGLAIGGMAVSAFGPAALSAVGSLVNSTFNPSGAVMQPDGCTLKTVYYEGKPVGTSRYCGNGVRSHGNDGPSYTKWIALAGLAAGAISFASAAFTNGLDQYLEMKASYTSSRAKFFDDMNAKYSTPREMDAEDSAVIAGLDDAEIEMLPVWMQCEAYMAQRDLGLLSLRESNARVDEMTITLALDYEGTDHADLLRIVKSELSEVMAYRPARKALKAHKHSMDEMFEYDLNTYNGNRWNEISKKSANKTPLTQDDKDFMRTTPYSSAVNEDARAELRRIKGNLGLVAAGGLMINNATPGGNNVAKGAGAGAGLAMLIITIGQVVHAFEKANYEAKYNKDVDHTAGMHDATAAKVSLRAGKHQKANVQNADKMLDTLSREHDGQKAISFHQPGRTLAHRIGLIN